MNCRPPVLKGLTAERSSVLGQDPACIQGRQLRMAQAGKVLFLTVKSNRPFKKTVLCWV